MEKQIAENYILRLEGCGYSRTIATLTYYDFMRYFNHSDLELFLEDMEKANDVSKQHTPTTTNIAG